MFFRIEKRLGNSLFPHRLSHSKPISFIMFHLCVCVCVHVFLTRLVHWQCNQFNIYRYAAVYHPTIELFSNQLKWIEILVMHVDTYPLPEKVIFYHNFPWYMHLARKLNPKRVHWTTHTLTHDPNKPRSSGQVEKTFQFRSFSWHRT